MPKKQKLAKVIAPSFHGAWSASGGEAELVDDHHVGEERVVLRHRADHELGVVARHPAALVDLHHLLHLALPTCSSRVPTPRAPARARHLLLRPDPSASPTPIDSASARSDETPITITTSEPKPPPAAPATTANVVMIPPSPPYTIDLMCPPARECVSGACSRAPEIVWARILPSASRALYDSFASLRSRVGICMESEFAGPGVSGAAVLAERLRRSHERPPAPVRVGRCGRTLAHASTAHQQPFPSGTHTLNSQPPRWPTRSPSTAASAA